MVVGNVDPLSATFAALGDPTRRKILGRLASGPATVSELSEPFRMSQQAISKHLAYLERARLIQKRREGRMHICTLKVAPIKAVADWAAEYRRFWEANFDRLEEYLIDLQTVPPVRSVKSALDLPKSKRANPEYAQSVKAKARVKGKKKSKKKARLKERRK